MKKITQEEKNFILLSELLGMQQKLHAEGFSSHMMEASTKDKKLKLRGYFCSIKTGGYSFFIDNTIYNQHE